MKCLAARMPTAWRWVALGLLLSAAGALGLVNLASAHPGGGAAGPRHAMPDAGLGGWWFGGYTGEAMLDDIGASDEQRVQLRRIADEARLGLRAGAEARRADRTRLAELLAQPKIDEAAVEALRRQALQRHDEATRQMQAAMLQAAHVLTPAQRARLAERMKQHAERAGARRDTRGGHTHGHPRGHTHNHAPDGQRGPMPGGAQGDMRGGPARPPAPPREPLPGSLPPAAPAASAPANR